MKNPVDKVVISGLGLKDEHGHTVAIIPVPFVDGARSKEAAAANTARFAAAWNATRMISVKALEFGIIYMSTEESSKAYRSKSKEGEIKTQVCGYCKGSGKMKTITRRFDGCDDSILIEDDFNEPLEKAVAMLKQIDLALMPKGSKILHGTVLHEGLKKLLAEIEEGA